MNPARLVLKICPPEDWAILQQLALQTFVDTFAEHNAPEPFQAYVDTAFSDRQVQSELANPESAFWMAWYGDQPVGYLKVNFGAAQTEHLGRPAMEIQRIYVVQDFQGTGVAQALLAKARELAAAAGVSMIWLGVWERNPKAVRFYQKNGFRKFGEHRFLMGEEEQTDWLMKIDIEKLS